MEWGTVVLDDVTVVVGVTANKQPVGEVAGSLDYASHEGSGFGTSEG